MIDPEPMSLRSYMAALAPGTQLREGLERIVSGRTGALIALGTNDELDALCTGGFRLDVEMTPTALRELAKMDGAIVISQDRHTILQAGVHLMPNAEIDTGETGTRHRTADKVARQTGIAMVAVSQSMASIGLFMGQARIPIEKPAELLPRTNQALQTLSSFRKRLQEALSRLDTLEVQDAVTIRDLCEVLQRWERVRRLTEEIEDHLVALGSQGRMARLLLDDSLSGFRDTGDLLVADYTASQPTLGLPALAEVAEADLLDAGSLAVSLGFGARIDNRARARGLRQLSGISRMPEHVAVRLLEHFGSLQGLFAAGVGELQEVDGVGAARARTLREGLVRIADAAYLRG